MNRVKTIWKKKKKSNYSIGKNMLQKAICTIRQKGFQALVSRSLRAEQQSLCGAESPAVPSAPTHRSFCPAKAEMVEVFVERDVCVHNHIFVDACVMGWLLSTLLPGLVIPSFRRTSLRALKSSLLYFFGVFFILRRLKYWKVGVAIPQNSRSCSSSTALTRELLLRSGRVKAVRLARSPKTSLNPNSVQAASIPSPLKQAMELTLLSTTPRLPRAFLWNVKKQNQLQGDWSPQEKATEEMIAYLPKSLPPLWKYERR